MKNAIAAAGLVLGLAGSLFAQEGEHGYLIGRSSSAKADIVSQGVAGTFIIDTDDGSFSQEFVLIVRPRTARDGMVTQTLAVFDVTGDQEIVGKYFDLYPDRTLAFRDMRAELAADREAAEQERIERAAKTEFSLQQGRRHLEGAEARHLDAFLTSPRPAPKKDLAERLRRAPVYQLKISPDGVISLRRLDGEGLLRAKIDELIAKSR